MGGVSVGVRTGNAATSGGGAVSTGMGTFLAGGSIDEVATDTRASLSGRVKKSSSSTSGAFGWVRGKTNITE